MDELYHARLSAHPHAPTEPEHPQPIPSTFPLPHPRIIPGPLPSVFLDAYPPPSTSDPVQEPKNIPSVAKSKDPGMKIGPWKFARPHPLLWISLLLTIIALVLGVPKGALPTLTGRHKALRVCLNSFYYSEVMLMAKAREKIVDEKLNLIDHLSHFLPPPLADLIYTNTPKPFSWTSADHHHLHQGSLKFWTSSSGYSQRGGEEGKWWSVEELADGASVVRGSRNGIGAEREVWVLRMGDPGEFFTSAQYNIAEETIGNTDQQPLLSALIHSLLLRDRLQQDLDDARSQAAQNLIVQPTIPPNIVVAENRHLALGHIDVSGGHEHMSDEDA